MNAPHPLQNMAGYELHVAAIQDREGGRPIRDYWDIARDNCWLIAGVTASAIAIGAGYAWLTPPVYQSNLLVQVEDTGGSAKTLLGEAGEIFDTKTPASAEVEIIRSRLVIGKAVENTRLHIEAEPKLLPVVGNWLSRRASGLSEPLLGGHVYGREKVTVGTFLVPDAWLGSEFTLTAQGEGHYSLSHPELVAPLLGKVGTPLIHTAPAGQLQVTITSLESKPGGQFLLSRTADLVAMQDLQSRLRLVERGRQSGVIEASLEGTDRTQIAAVLNEIGQQYVKQNVERKAAEAQKSLAFLDQQMPLVQKQLTQSEEAYTQFRNQRGTVALNEEARLIISRGADVQARLLDAQQRRRELAERFGPEHPAIKTIDEQITAWAREASTINARARVLPNVQQNAVRLERDVQANTELYRQLRNSALQLQLIREGKIGTVRVIDPAVTPLFPVHPNRGRAVGVALMLGLIAAFALAMARNAWRRGIRSAQEIEEQTGLSVYGTIPFSKNGHASPGAPSKAGGVRLLASAAPQDPAIESLWSLRTSLQFAMLQSPDHRVLITGATPGVGKSFVAANLAAVMAGGGKRVLLIDADLRNGQLHRYFGIERDEGLSDLLNGDLDPERAVRRNVIAGLDFLPTGSLPPNPAETMTGASFVHHLHALSRSYDLVILDAAPVLVAADTLSIAAHAGTLFLVARAGQSEVGELSESARRLSRTGKAVTGVLFNAVDPDRLRSEFQSESYGNHPYRRYGRIARAA